MDWATTDKITGRDRQLQRLAMKIPEITSVRIGARGTSGSVRRVKGGDGDASRTAGENVIVLRTQAKQGRDIAFLTDEEKHKAADFWKRAFAKAWEQPATASAAIIREAASLGTMIMRWFVAHIERGVSRDGSVQPVKLSTQKRKDREVGPGKPPLVRTGQLLRAFMSSVRTK